MPGFRPGNIAAGLAAFALIAAAPPAPDRIKRANTRVAGQTAAQGGAAGGTAAGAGGAAAAGGILQSTWFLALAGLVAAGGLTAVALSNSNDAPVSPGS